MPSSTLFLTTLPPGVTAKPSKDGNNQFHYPTRTRLHNNSNFSSIKFRCRSSASSSSWITDFDLYELLGVESSSDQSEIKKAYRGLQKRCHPDIAGPAGHDMAIILNEVYSLLSDPNSRAAYDQEQAKLSEFKGYTGKTLYSTWFGSEDEQRAVFVDEVKCVGCLKCALYANKTFAIESAYGRARVIAQWADPEHKILDAIQICPVDCISFVERSDLAALEFLMSKQPRGNVRMTGGGNIGGVRVSNIFADVNKFQKRFHEMKDKAPRKESMESDLQRDLRTSAMQGIRSISNWWYWQSPIPTTAEDQSSLKLTHTPRKTTKPGTDKLREAAARLKLRGNSEPSHRSSSTHENNEDYWTPLLTLPSPSSISNVNASSSQPPPSTILEDLQKEPASGVMTDKRKQKVLDLRGPLLMGLISALMVGSRGREMTETGLNDHLGGDMALEVVNSFAMQIILAGTTWFVIGMGIAGIFEALKSRDMFRR